MHVRGRLLLLWVSVAIFAVAPTFAESRSAPIPARVRGTVAAVDEAGVTVRQVNGARVRLSFYDRTTFAVVVPSRPDAIGVGDFVGAAVTGAPASMRAVEAAIVPMTMRAGRIPLYSWDPLPDPAVAGAPTTLTRMTNGLVAAERSRRLGRELTVTYDGGRRHFLITVPRNAPVVRYVPEDKAALTVGSIVMIKTDPGGKAGLVTIGRGVKPPM